MLLGTLGAKAQSEQVKTRLEQAKIFNATSSFNKF